MKENNIITNTSPNGFNYQIYVPDKIDSNTPIVFYHHGSGGYPHDYNELNELEGELEGVKNYSVAVKEKGDDVIFLRKIVEGPADESYGIYVAKLAGVPNAVVNRAKKILNKS